MPIYKAISYDDDEREGFKKGGSKPGGKGIGGKAGRSRWLGRRPHTRGVVKNPVDHPHGGGEGKSAGGRHPVSPTGQSAKGLKTRDNKRTDKFIVKRRNKRKDTK